MADVRTELAQLRPVYETGALRMLLRPNARIYVALLRAAFDPLTGEVPQERLLADMADSLVLLIGDGSFEPHEGEDAGLAARRILRELKAQSDDDYAWIADSVDRRTHRVMCRLTQRAHRAIEALGTLQQRTVSLSGAQVNSIILEVENARKQLTVDVEERIGILQGEIDERQRQIDQLRATGTTEPLTAEQVSDIINVVHNTLRGVPVDLRDLVVAERDNGDELRRRMDGADVPADELLAFYHEGYERIHRLSDEGRRFEDAFQIMYAPESRREIGDALQDIAHSAWMHDDADELMDTVNREFDDIYDGIDAVRHQVRQTDETIRMLVRQQSDMQFRTMSRQLGTLLGRLGDAARGGRTLRGPKEFDIGTGSVSLPTVATRARETPARASAPQLAQAQPATPPDLHAIVAASGPRIVRMLELIEAAPAMRGGFIDVAASFNGLPVDERRESEIVGFLSYLAPCEGSSQASEHQDFERRWRCVDADGDERIWTTAPLAVGADTLREFLAQA